MAQKQFTKENAREMNAKRKTHGAGTGRPPSEIRAACAESFDKRRHILDDIADDNKAPYADRIRALTALAKIGIPEQKEISGNDGKPVPILIIDA